MTRSSKAPQQAVLVLGMHRSGTSALTRGLEVLGFELGRNLKPPVEGDNSKGFFEDWTLSTINDELLTLIGGAWDSLLARDPSEADARAVNELKLKALDAIAAEFGEAPRFAFKDPRSCRAAPFWKDVLARHGAETTYVIAFRNPMDVAHSLEKRDGFSRARSYYLWLLHMLAAVRHTAGERRVFVDFDDLIADPEAVITRVADAIGADEVAIDREAMRAYCLEFLDPKLQHNKGTPARLDLDEQCPPEARAVYALLRQEAEDAPGARDALWQAQFDAFEQLAPYSLLLDDLDRHVRRLRRVNDGLTAELSAVQERLGTAQRAAEAAHALAEKHGAETEEARRQVAELLQRLDELQHRHNDALNGLKQLEATEARYAEALQASEVRYSEALEASGRLRTQLDNERLALLARAQEAEQVIELERQRMNERMTAIEHAYVTAAQERGVLEGRFLQVQEELQRERRISGEQLQLLKKQFEASSDELQAENAQARAQFAAREAQLAAAYDDLANRLRSVYASTSWRLGAPLRAIKTVLSGGAKASEAVASLDGALSMLPAPAPVPSATYAPAVAARGPVPSFACFTICSRNFLAFAKTLFQTLKEHHPEIQFYVALCDAPAPPFNPAEEPFPFIYLDDLDLPEWREMSQRYNITEFNTAIKPFVFRHLMKRRVADAIIYLDPDIIVKGRMVELEQAFADGALGVLTPHVTGPAENVEVSDVKMLQYGVYNLGFAAFRACPEADEAMAWWGRRLIKDCVIKLEEGLFVDQKWADLLPAYLPRLHVLRHPGYNVAYWNVAQRRVTLENGVYKVNGEPLRFAHFSGSKLEDPSVYSRHTGQFNTKNIGDLVHLLNEYRDRVFGNDHARYQRIPYAFSWNGEAGVNLHTPEPEHLRQEASATPPSQTNAMSLPTEASTVVSMPPPRSGPARALHLVRTASNLAGGLPQLAAKATHVLATGGIGAVMQRVRFVETAATEVELRKTLQAQAPSPTAVEAGATAPALQWRKRLLFIDWSTPRPDRDAGSLTAYHLMEILVSLGYDVTFVPSDLEYLGAYTEGLRALGVRCLHREDIGSVKAHLEQEGARYDVAFLCRAPIAGLYIADIRAHAPGAKIILNTSDLHYLRDMREAELAGDKAQIEAAQKAKDWELGIIRSCDVTIVMSEVERALLAQETPGCDVRLIPLMFVEVEPWSAPYSERKDIIFIGGFPHQPNVDAVLYFAREVFPRVRARLPDLTWHIVGNAPPPEVIALGEQPGIRVHGYVKDIAPLFRSVRLSIAPLRYGAGIKGKLGTSLSYGVPAVATSIASEGMHIQNGEHVLVADDSIAFADAVVQLYTDESTWARMSRAGRAAMLQEYSVATGRRRIDALMNGLSPTYPRIEAYSVQSEAHYHDLLEVIGSDIAKRKELETALIRKGAKDFSFQGFCAVCGARSSFRVGYQYAAQTEDGDTVPNWREHLACTGCGLPNRLRAALHLFNGLLRPARDGSIYLTEQATPLFQRLRAQFPNLIGSEYLGDRYALGESWEGLRNEDLTKLSFAPGRFDYVLSFDVMEHVSDDIAAMEEVYRCLKPGGRFFFTAPFSQRHSSKVVRARQLPNGEIEHFLPPEYHGNPVDADQGSLCYRYFAWDLLDDLRRAGFENCRAIHYWSADYAYLGGEQFVFIADKPRTPHALH